MLSPDDIRGKFEAFSSLRPGWDSYDAEPPSLLALERARALVAPLAEGGITPALHVCPSVEGGIAFCWQAPGVYADIEIFNDGEIMAIVSADDEEPDVWPVAFESAAIRAAIDRCVAFCAETSIVQPHIRTPATLP